MGNILTHMPTDMQISRRGIIAAAVLGTGVLKTTAGAGVPPTSPPSGDNDGEFTPTNKFIETLKALDSDGIKNSTISGKHVFDLVTLILKRDPNDPTKYIDLSTDRTFQFWKKSFAFTKEVEAIEAAAPQLRKDLDKAMQASPETPATLRYGELFSNPDCFKELAKYGRCMRLEKAEAIDFIAFSLSVKNRESMLKKVKSISAAKKRDRGEQIPPNAITSYLAKRNAIASTTKQ